MTQRDLAGYLGVTPMTIRNWRKEKPNLYKTIMKGIKFDEIVQSSKEAYERAKEIQQQYDDKTTK